MSQYWDSYRKRTLSRRRVLAGSSIAAAGVAGMALAGCGDDDDDDGGSGNNGGQNLTPVIPTQTTEQPVKGGTLRGLATIGSILDPHRTNTPHESVTLWGAVGNTLVRFSTKNQGSVEGDLATGLPEIPADGLTLTFKIRPEAKWQNKAPVNGRAVTAEDVKMSFDRIKDPATVSPRAGNFGAIDSVTVIDAQTVQFKLKTPQADLMAAMSDQYNFIIPKEIASRGPDAIKTAADVIGSGPYELVEFVAAQKSALKRRADGYWRQNTSWLDGAEYIHQTDPQQALNALRANQTDVIGTTADLAKTIENDKNFVITKAPTTTRECLLINHGKDRYKDPRVRLALQRAINRKQVYDTVFGGVGWVGGPMTPAAPVWVLPDAELAKLPGFGKREDEIKEAKALLAAAGLANGFEETVITVTAFDTEKIHDVVVSNLKDIGVTVKTENVGTDFAANFLPREVGRQYDLATTLFLSGGYPDAQLLLYHHSDTKTKGTRNYGDYSLAGLDAKLEKQSTIYDEKTRLALVQEIQRDIINAPGPIWFGSQGVLTVWASRVKNPASFPFAAGYYGSENIWLKA
ncbi:MAG: ABC transporter substrate-binding protein [Dehalococcoidia bacterium]|uniref:ABC transporter substrate-binding protein n=1 Tax=Candidatus Amarobacter glycogenicus TaxID=3140699 RepID=UPI0031375F44|nr:ABC transporter substrate-binding protein [Dehalococcoidia bacterium]